MFFENFLDPRCGYHTTLSLSMKVEENSRLMFTCASTLILLSIFLTRYFPRFFDTLPLNYLKSNKRLFLMAPFFWRLSSIFSKIIINILITSDVNILHIFFTIIITRHFLNDYKLTYLKKTYSKMIYGTNVKIPLILSL